MALGPMSTPRLSWPRSIGTPKIPTGSRSFLDKGGSSRTPRIGRGLEVGLAGAGLVGEEVAFRVEARGEDGILERHPEIEYVYDRLEYGRGYARGAGRAERDEAAFLRGYDGRAHVGDQTFTRLERVEPPRV